MRKRRGEAGALRRVQDLFMHLRYERLSFVCAVIVPMVFLAVVLWTDTFPDALSVFHLRR
jgi:cytochrome c oxidase subunit IV